MGGRRHTRGSSPWELTDDQSTSHHSDLLVKLWEAKLRDAGDRDTPHLRTTALEQGWVTLVLRAGLFCVGVHGGD